MSQDQKSNVTLPGRIMYKEGSSKWYQIGSAKLKLYFTINKDSFIVDGISLVDINKVNSSNDYSTTINGAGIQAQYSWMTLVKGNVEKSIIPHPTAENDYLNTHTVYLQIGEERFLKPGFNGNNSANFTTTIPLTENDYGVYSLEYGSDEKKVHPNLYDTRFWLSKNNVIFTLDYYDTTPKISIFPDLDGSDPSQATMSGIITNKEITATRVTALKDYIKALASYRGLSIKGLNPNNTSQELTRNLPTDFSSWNPSITSGTKIDETNLGDILNHALIINDFQNLKFSKDGQKIFYNGSTSDLLDFFSSKYKESATSSNHGCRGACLGICSGGCYNTTKGNAGANGCDGCGGGCWGSCDGTCSKEGTKECDCFNCTGECWGSCTGTCGGCGGCYYGCYGACQDTCKDGCATDCNTGCFTGCKGTCVSIANSTT